jgi:CzcA family heavy metal efflux pump
MIGHVVQSSLRLRALVVVFAVIVMAIGVVSLRRMPVDVYPEILPVTVTVQTEALGLSAEEVEQLITVPIEADLLTGTPWVDVMRSESVPGLSSIELVFKPGTDPMHARQVVQERLTQAHALPNVSHPPQMLQPLSSTNRVMLVSLTSDQQSLIEMSVLARWTIRPRLLGIPGVANVSVWGLRERQLQVRVEPEKLRDARVTLLQIIKTAGNSLWYSPLTFLEASVAGTGGFVETPNQRIGVRHVLPISTAADLAKVPVEGTGVRLDQVATVVEDHQPLIGDGLNQGGQGLLLAVEKLPGANTLKVSDDVIAALEALKPGLGGIEFDTRVYHPASYIRSAIGSVSNALVFSLVLLVVMLLAVLGTWRAAVIGLVTIPASLIAAALALYFTKTTANVMLFAGLVIALGVIVDDLIVFTGGVLRRLRDGSATSAAKAIVDSSGEVRRSMIFATACLLLAALPLLFLRGEAGEFVKPMVQAYGLAVLASMLVAATLAPALALFLLGGVRTGSGESPFVRWVASMAEGVSPAMGRALAVLAIVAGLVAVALVPRLRAPVAPTFKEFDLMIHWDAQPGTSRTEMNRIMGLAAAELRGVPGVRNVGGHVGRAILADKVVGIHSGELWVSLDPSADYDKTVATIEDVARGYPGVDADVVTYLSARFGEVLSRVDEPIRVRLYGQRLDVLKDEAAKLSTTLAGIQGISDVRTHDEPTEPIVEIMVDLEKAKAHGVKPGDVRRSAAALVSGMMVGNLFEEQKLFEVVVWSEPRVRHSLEAIRNLLVDAPGGRHVRLGDVSSVEIVAAPQVIQRENVARYVDVVADVRGRPVAAVAADVNARLRGTAFPLEYRAELLGGFAAQEAAKARMKWVAFAAAIGILIILQAAFSSWPLAIMFLVSLPVALGGGVLAAFATGGALSLGAAAGLLMVFAVSVRQGILLVQRYMNLRREGLEWGPELFARGVSESAPGVLMTALVTGATLLPFAVFGSRPGHEILGPMVVVILGGLVTATIYSLCVLPALYARFGERAEIEEVEDLDVDTHTSPELQRI